MDENKKGSFLNIYGMIFVVFGSLNLLFFHLLSGMKGNVVASVRILLMVLVLALIATFGKKWTNIEKREWGYLIIGGALSFGLYTYCLATGLAATSLTQGSIIFNLAAVFAMVFAVIFGQEKWNWAAFFGALVAIGGVAISTITASGQGTGTIYGDVLVLIAAASLSLGTVIAHKIGTRHHPVALTSLLGFFGLIALLPFTIIDFVDTPWFSLDWNKYSMLLFVGILGGALAFGAYFKCVELVGASASVVYIFLNVPLSIFYSKVFLNESVDLLQIIGAIIVLAGAGWSVYARNKAAKIEIKHHVSHV
jgi:drug/metabolite transporter (DMT)-like permease